MLISNRFFMVAIFLSPQFIQAQERPRTPLPHSMASLGDSISAGVLANFSREQGSNPWLRGFVLGKLFQSLLARDLGPIEAPSFSWSTGLDRRQRVMSHAQHLNALQPSSASMGKFRTHNSAFSGAQARHVRTEQVPELMAWSHRNLGQNAPDYVTLLVGPNDLCAERVEDMTPTEDYLEDLRSVVDELLQKSPRTRLLIAGIPKVTQLWEVARSAPLIGRGHLAGTCGDLWRTTRMCPTLTLETDPHQRELVANRLREYNEGLAEIAHSRSREFPDRVRFAAEVSTSPFNADDISLDCFHPGPRGQQKIADQSWRSSWWGGPQ